MDRVAAALTVPAGDRHPDPAGRSAPKVWRRSWIGQTLSAWIVRSSIGNWEQARASFHALITGANDIALCRPSNGTWWTNSQLLFHMLLGYLILRALRLLVLVFGRLPDGASRAYARRATRPFDAVNYLGSRLGGSMLSTRRMAIMFDRVIAKLHRRLDAESDADLTHMHYPTRWDPFFTDYMTLADVYRFPFRHFEFHRRQLTLNEPTP